MLNCRVVLGVFVISLAFSQTPPRAEFEVASVRQNTRDDHIVTIDVGPGPRFTARGYTLVLLIQRAYGVMDWNVTGRPGWIRVDRFDVSAKANVSGNLTEAQLQVALQKLLAERFNLRIHHAERKLPGYALVIAGDRAKLTPAAPGEERQDTFRMDQAGLSAQAISMANFARFVGGKLGLIAADETGLPGLYDVKAQWQVETTTDDDRRDAMRFAVNSALHEQLGLKLVAKRIRVPTIVIDRAEKPLASAN
ncbi:MAG: TIGR03435 family protein [Acidobacteriia bacterium]|nr:TIGR03435 family protein [Terriglobia bacterium]